MVKILKGCGEWKRVEVGGDLLTGDSTNGCLAGIEELTDYRLVDAEETPKRNARETKKKKKAKRNKKKRLEGAKKNVFKVEDRPPSDDSQDGQDAAAAAAAATEEKEENEDGDIDDTEEDERPSGNLIEDLLPWTNIFVPAEIARSLVEQGFKYPTEIQRLSIPAAIEGRRDLLGAAETGSGKTLAFGIPIITGIMNQLEHNQNDESPGGDDDDTAGSELESDADDNQASDCVRVKNLGFVPHKNRGGDRLWSLVIAPTRELALQVGNHLKTAAKYTRVKVGIIVGGMSSEKQTRILNKKRPHIVVATPGRLWELITNGERHLANIHNIRYLVIDETDRMLEKDHFPELRQLLEKINYDPGRSAAGTEEDAKKKNRGKAKEKQKRRQNFVFSATLTFVHEPPEHLKRKRKRIKKSTPGQKLNDIMKLLGMVSPKVVDVTKQTGTADKLTESRITCSMEDKDVYLHYFLERHPGRTLVFCNSIAALRRLASLLTLLGTVRPLPLHAQMHQRQRLNNLDKFKSDPRGVLLATDVAARGLDIPSVEHVVHYQVPRTSESYIHRSGRTARAGNEGLTLLLIEPSEVKNYTKICSSLGRDEDLTEFPVDDGGYPRAKERVTLAREIDLLAMSLRKTQSSATWMEKAAKDMDIVLDEDQLPKRPDTEAEAKMKQILKMKRKKLTSLLSRPLLRTASDIRRELDMKEELDEDDDDENEDEDREEEEKEEVSSPPAAKRSKKAPSAVECAKYVMMMHTKPKFRIYKVKK